MLTSDLDNCISDVDIWFSFFLVFTYMAGLLDCCGCQHPIQTIAFRMSTSDSNFFEFSLRMWLVYWIITDVDIRFTIF